MCSLEVLVQILLLAMLNAVVAHDLFKSVSQVPKVKEVIKMLAIEYVLRKFELKINKVTE
jgi:hypothetical protein